MQDGARLGTDHAIGMNHAYELPFDQLTEPVFRNQLDIGLADTRRYADNQLVAAGNSPDPPQVLLYTFRRPRRSSLTISLLQYCQRRNVAQLSQFARNLIRNELSVCENLGNSSRMRCEDIEQLGCRKGSPPRMPK